MEGYTKLFGSIVASTIWREDNATRIVWITMLAISSSRGIVEASIPGLADLARLSVEETEAAITKLLSPDRYSRTKTHEGRRILEVDGGWLIINRAKYRAMMAADDRREYLRIKKQESRDRDVNKCQQSSTRSTQQSRAEQSKEKVPPYPPKGGEVRSTIPQSTVVPEPLNVPEFRGLWEKFLKHRKEMKKPMTLHAQDLKLRQLAKMGSQRAAAAVEHSLANGWQGVFEPFNERPNGEIAPQENQI